MDIGSSLFQFLFPMTQLTFASRNPQPRISIYSGAFWQFIVG